MSFFSFFFSFLMFIQATPDLKKGLLRSLFVSAKWLKNPSYKLYTRFNLNTVNPITMQLNTIDTNKTTTIKS